MRHVSVWGLALLLSALGCGESGVGPSGYDYRSEGALLYAEQCAVCHGEAGQGGLGVALVDGEYDAHELERSIDESMPKGDPMRCTGECAQKIARFIVEGLRSDELACQAVAPSPRRLRLLTRREYRNTVNDLIDGLAPQSCQAADACGFRQRCQDEQCLQETCTQHTFVFDPGGRNLSTVHMAGSFNGWAARIADGGLALQRDASGLWTGRFAIAEGSHTYKIVLDENEWITDSRASESSPDGFGGFNSVLALSCGGSEGFDPAQAFPAEVRPDGFAFETHADSGYASPIHVDAHLNAAERVASELAGRMLAEPGCGRDDECARDFLARLAPRAFRRPLRAEEEQALLTLIQDADDFKAGLETASTALLMSPSFLYRSELGEAGGGGIYRLTSYEIASALSYTFWGTMPDAELWSLAESDELDSAEIIEAQARRLLADSRSRPAIETFAAQWLGAESIASVDKNANMFPSFDDELRRDMLNETRRFVSHVIFSGSGLMKELFSADYSIASERLASHYGLSVDPEGRMAYSQGHRSGILGHGSILGTTAHSDQTSPIRRGLFVRRQLLCQDLPPPPPFAGGVPEVDPGATTRDRFAMHTSNEVCAGCHSLIDGVGFGFERFDPVGAYRESEAGLPIDASGNVTDIDFVGAGTDTAFASLPELGQALAHSDAAASCFVRQYFRFTRGYREGLADRCARQWLEDRFAGRDFDLKELFLDMVLSPDFVERQ